MRRRLICCPAQGYTGDAELAGALKDADLVIIPAGVPRKPGMTRDDLFNINAGIVRTLIMAVAEHCPKVRRLGSSFSFRRRPGALDAGMFGLTWRGCMLSHSYIWTKVSLTLKFRGLGCHVAGEGNMPKSLLQRESTTVRTGG